MEFTFEDQLNALIWYYLGDYESGRDLIQALGEDEMACALIVPNKGVLKSTFFEAINDRGLSQIMEVLRALYTQASETLPSNHATLGELVLIDGSFIDATLSMNWANFRKGI